MINIITLPQSKDSFFYDTGLALQTVFPQSQFNSFLGITVCPTRKGTVWLVYDDVTSGVSTLIEFNLTTQLQTNLINVINGGPGPTVARLVGEQNGAHSVME